MKSRPVLLLLLLALIWLAPLSCAPQTDSSADVNLRDSEGARQDVTLDILKPTAEEMDVGSDQKLLTISGKTNPQAYVVARNLSAMSMFAAANPKNPVSIGGQSRAGSDGRFSIYIGLTPGQNEIEIVASLVPPEELDMVGMTPNNFAKTKIVMNGLSSDPWIADSSFSGSGGEGKEFVADIKQVQARDFSSFTPPQNVVWRLSGLCQRENAPEYDGYPFLIAQILVKDGDSPYLLKEQTITAPGPFTIDGDSTVNGKMCYLRVFALKCDYKIYVEYSLPLK